MTIIFFHIRNLCWRQLPVKQWFLILFLWWLPWKLTKLLNEKEWVLLATMTYCISLNIATNCIGGLEEKNDLLDTNMTLVYQFPILKIAFRKFKVRLLVLLYCWNLILKIVALKVFFLDKTNLNDIIITIINK